MNNVNKTLYIPLYGKSYVSKKGKILCDPKAELIWEKEGFKLKGKSKSKWLAYYMGMRSAVIDKWLEEQMKEDINAVILHLGCGMDSRIERVGNNGHIWYDVDFLDVIKERRKYYKETDLYHMIESDVRDNLWMQNLPGKATAIVVLEGISMYLTPTELENLFLGLNQYFSSIKVLMDCYTQFAAKASKFKNPINDVGVTDVFGIDNPQMLEENTELRFIKEYDMTPSYLINELHGMEKVIFKHVYGGKFAKRMYRMYEYATIAN